MRKTFSTVPLDQVQTDGAWNADNWPDLRDSIKQHGQLVPVLCVRAGSKYKMKGGRKRYAILKALGRPTINLLLLEPEEGDDHDGQLLLLPEYAITLAENIHESNPLSEARDIAAALEDGRDKAWLLENFGLSSSEVDRRLSLLALTDDAQVMLEKGELRLTVAYKLAKQTPAHQVQILHAARNDKGKVSVKAVNAEMKKLRVAAAPVRAVPFPNFVTFAAAPVVDYVSLAAQIEQVAMSAVCNAEQAQALLQAVDMLKSFS